jgi:hypothetical protein
MKKLALVLPLLIRLACAEGNASGDPGPAGVQQGKFSDN